MEKEKKNWWKRFTESVTRLKSSVTSDLVLITQIRLLGAYIFVAIAIFIISGLLWTTVLVDILTTPAVRDSLSILRLPAHTDDIDEAVIVNIWVVRALVFAGGILLFIFLTEFILNPIRKRLEFERRFISHISHELRTPLSTIRANAEMTQNLSSQDLPDDIREYVASSIREVDRMSGIIKFFLDFTRDHRGIEGVDRNITALSAIVEKTVKDLEISARQKGVKIICSHTLNGYVYGNKAILSILVMNLFRNALSETREGGLIMALVREDKKYVTLIIEDSGAGITRRGVRRMLQPFSSRISKTEVYDHFGIGLAIVKDVIDFHQAEFFVKTRIGKGTSYSIRFPHPQKMPSLISALLRIDAGKPSVISKNDLHVKTN